MENKEIEVDIGYEKNNEEGNEEENSVEDGIHQPDVDEILRSLVKLIVK